MFKKLEAQQRLNPGDIKLKHQLAKEALGLASVYLKLCKFDDAIKLANRFRGLWSYFRRVEKGSPFILDNPLLFIDALKKFKGMKPLTIPSKELLTKPEKEWPWWLRRRVEICRKMGAIDW